MIKPIDQDDIKELLKIPAVKWTLIGGGVFLALWGGRYVLNNLAGFIRECKNVHNAWVSK